MRMAEPPLTRVTLLTRLRDGRDGDAWREFFDLSRPRRTTVRAWLSISFITFCSSVTRPAAASSCFRSSSVRVSSSREPWRTRSTHAANRN